MNLLKFLQSFIARTFLTCQAAASLGTSGAPVTAPPPDYVPPAAPEKPAKAEKGDDPEDDVDDVDPDDLEAVKDGEEVDDGDEDEDSDDDEDDDEKDPDGEDDEDDEDDDADLMRETYETRIAAKLQAAGTQNPYNVTLPGLEDSVLTADERKAMIAKLAPKDAEADELAGAEAIVDLVENLGRKVAVSLLGKYHNEAMVPVRRNMDTAAGRAAITRDAETLAKKYPELRDEKLQKRIVDGPMKHFDEKFGVHVRADVPLKALLRMVPKKARLAARARVLATRGGKRAGKSESDLSAEEREVALGGSTAPRGGTAKTAPGPKKKPSGDLEDRRALAASFKKKINPNFW